MSQEKHKSRKFVVDSLIIFGVTIGIILTLEVFLRLFYPQTLMGVPINEKVFSYLDETLGMQYVPGAKWHFSHPEYLVEYAINEHGFRDTNDHRSPNPEHKTRILLLGDSFTFGQGVNYDQTWPVLVEELLQKSGKSQFEFIKAGIQGMDSRSEFIMMQRLLEECQCDIVVVSFLINDLYTNTLHGVEINNIKSQTEGLDGESIDDKYNTSEREWYDTLQQVFLSRDNGSEFHLLTLAKRLAISVDEIYCRSYVAAPDRGKWLTTPLSDKVEKQLQITKNIFELMARYCLSLGKKLIVLSIPQQFQALCYERYKESPEIDVTLYDRYFTELAEENNFNWVSTHDEFVNINKDRDKLFYRLDGHLTPEGNEVVSQVFFNQIIPMIE